MANREQAFRQHQLTRALKAAQAAGGANPHVRVVLPNGTQLFLSGGEVEAPVPKVRGKTATPVRDSSSVSKSSLPGSQTRAPLAEGGGSRMAGRGDRTTTAASDAAGKQQPGGTGHRTVSRGSKLAEGGAQHMFPKQAAEPAKAGQTGKEETLAGSRRASGGLSLPAKPGQCGT